MACFDFEIAFMLLLIGHSAQLGGIDYLETDAWNACCDPSQANSTAPDLPNSEECFVASNVRLQWRMLSAAISLLVVTFLLTLGCLISTQSLTRYPALKGRAAALVGFLARPKFLILLSLVTVMLSAFGMAVALSLSHAPCISDTPVWDTYSTYMGIGIFVTVCTVLYLHHVIGRVLDAFETSPVVFRATYKRGPSRTRAGEQRGMAPLDTAKERLVRETSPDFLSEDAYNVVGGAVASVAGSRRKDDDSV